MSWLTWRGRRRNWGGILVDFPLLGVLWGMGKGREGGAGVPEVLLFVPVSIAEPLLCSYSVLWTFNQTKREFPRAERSWCFPAAVQLLCHLFLSKTPAPGQAKRMAKAAGTPAPFFCWSSCTQCCLQCPGPHFLAGRLERENFSFPFSYSNNNPSLTQ